MLGSNLDLSDLVLDILQEYISCLLQSLLLHVPRLRLKTKGDRAFSVAAPRLWNSLPLHIRSCDSLDCFKSVLKTHLYAVAYSCL